MNELEREMLLDILEESGFMITINESQLIKAEKDKSHFFRIFIGKALECVLTEPHCISAANQLDYSQLVEYIDSQIEG